MPVKNTLTMRKSRVRLHPHLIAQTTPNPNFTPKRLMKLSGAIFLLAAGFFVVRMVASSPGEISLEQNTGPLPQDEQVLGAQAIDGSPDYYLYQVKDRDTIFSISERFQVKWEDIARLNDLKDPYFLTPGASLKLPTSPVTEQQRFYDNLKYRIYVVESGDTFVSIAQKLNISVTELLKANPQLESPDLLQPGQKLNLP